MFPDLGHNSKFCFKTRSFTFPLLPRMSIASPRLVSSSRTTESLSCPAHACSHFPVLLLPAAPQSTLTAARLNPSRAAFAPGQRQPSPIPRNRQEAAAAPPFPSSCQCVCPNPNQSRVHLISPPGFPSTAQNQKIPRSCHNHTHKSEKLLWSFLR